MTTPIEEKKIVSEVNAEILIVRTLLRSAVGSHREILGDVNTMARYCQLLTSRMRVSPINARRLVLAVWVHALGDHSPLAAQFVQRHRLDEFLSPPDGMSSEETALEVEIFEMVEAYHRLQKEDPRVGKDLPYTRKKLETLWKNSCDAVLLRRFLQILRDEAFLEGARQHAGHILLVDPEESVTPVLSAPLRNEGFEVVVCADVGTANEALRVQVPDIILAVKDIPVTDGLEFCLHVKTNPALASIPFLMFLSKHSKTAERNCLKAGCEEVIVKPVDLELLTIRIKRALAARPQAAAPAGPTAGVTGNLGEINFTDLIQIVCVGSKSLAIELARGSERGEVYIQAGEIVHAKVGEVTGETAFYGLMQWKDGSFVSRPCSQFPPRTVNESLMSLLMEGSRQADEGT